MKGGGVHKTINTDLLWFELNVVMFIMAMRGWSSRDLYLPSSLALNIFVQFVL